MGFIVSLHIEPLPSFEDHSPALSSALYTHHAHLINTVSLRFALNFHHFNFNPVLIRQTVTLTTFMEYLVAIVGRQIVSNHQIRAIARLLA